MSAERMVRGALWRAVAAKVAGDVVGGAGDLAHTVGRVLDRFADCAFYVEADAARKYRNLTGVDLGYVIGENDRFAGADPDYEPVDAWSQIAIDEPDEDDEE